MVGEYRRLYYEQHNIAVARVTTARPLSEELESSIREKLSQTIGKQIVLEKKVDASILGGVVLDFDGERMDTSVRTQLGKIRKQILSNGIA